MLVNLAFIDRSNPTIGWSETADTPITCEYVGRQVSHPFSQEKFYIMQVDMMDAIKWDGPAGLQRIFIQRDNDLFWNKLAKHFGA